MANTNTKQVILDIQLSYKQLIDGALQIQKELDKIAIEQTKLNGAYKAGEVTLEEYDRQMIAINAETKRLKDAYRDVTKEIDANLKKEEAQNGSLKQMRQELKLLIKAYDEMSAAERDSAAGTEQQQKIQALQKELKELEGATGRFQRNVGDYRNAIQEAINGTVPLKTVLKELKNELQTLTLQQRQYDDEIKAQKAILDQLGATVGTDTEEYRHQAQALADLEQKYNETNDAITNMQLTAGQIQDTIDDTSTSIKNFGKDNANIKAVSEGMGVLANSYAVLQAGMTALGAESEDLVKVWAKMQVVQQGINALNQIAAALEKESVLRQQLRIALNKLLGKSIEQTAAAKTKDAAASTAAAAGDTALAAGETAATAAAGGLVTALKAVGAAIKSIPIIGWIAGAVAILGTLTALVIKHNKAEKENNQTLQQRKALMREINEVEKESLESVQKNVVAMEANVRRLKEAEVGTREWSNLVKEVAGDLGVTEEWLQKNVDKVDELKDAWVNMQIAMAKGEAYAKKIADNEIKIATAEAEIARIMSDTKYKDRAEAISKELGVSIKAAKALVEADHKLKKNNTSANFVAYANAKNAIIEEIQTQNKALMNGLDDAYKQQVEASEELTKIAGDGIKETGNKAKKEATSVKKDVTKTAKELSEELENLMVEGMADGLEKNIKQVEVAAERYIEKMKEAREKDAENKEKYDAIILQYEKNTQDKIRKMRADGYQTILANAEKLTESYNQLWASYAPNSFYNFINDLAATATKVSNEVNAINKEIRDLEALVDQYKKTQGAESIFAADQESLAKQLKEQLKDQKEPITMPVKPELVLDGDAVRTQWRKIIEKLSGVVSAANAKELADAWNEELKGISRHLVNGTNVLDIKRTIDSYLNGIAGKTAEGAEKVRNALREAFNAILNDNGGLDELQSKLNQYAADLEKYNKRQAENNKTQKENAAIQAQIAEADAAAAQARQNEAVATENLNTAQEKLAEANKNYLSNLDESILKNRALNKSLREYAKTIQQVLLEQAKLGNIDIIPQDFSVYIDYQIDKLEEELAKAYRKLEKLAPTAGDENNEDYKQQRERYNNIQGQLQAMKQARDNVSKDMVTRSATGGFLDNSELVENATNIARVANQIKVLQQVLEQGTDINSQISTAEEENNYLYKQRIALLSQISQAVTAKAKAQKEAELQEIDEQIALNNETVANLKQTLSLMGYTTEEEMRQLLESLKKQEKAFSDETGVIMKKAAASVVQSIGTIANSLLDLMTAIGEDNAEMANFLEGVAYMQIGVNMAVGIAEAIAAGAGVAFPANLAAIATGVAAVISGIASAISTYKQYHKDVASPSFATGGLIGMRYARTREEGTRDDINIRASRGEYIVNAQAVKAYGVDFFDSINFGRKRPTHRGLNFADGGMVDVTTATKAVANEESYAMLSEALMNMPAPEVSVMEITKVQNKVKAKESTARR